MNNNESITTAIKQALHFGAALGTLLRRIMGLAGGVHDRFPHKAGLPAMLCMILFVFAQHAVLGADLNVSGAYTIPAGNTTIVDNATISGSGNLVLNGALNIDRILTLASGGQLWINAGGNMLLGPYQNSTISGGTVRVQSGSADISLGVTGNSKLTLINTNYQQNISTEGKTGIGLGLESRTGGTLTNYQAELSLNGTTSFVSNVSGTRSIGIRTQTGGTGYPNIRLNDTATFTQTVDGSGAVGILFNSYNSTLSLNGSSVFINNVLSSGAYGIHNHNFAKLLLSDQARYISNVTAGTGIYNEGGASQGSDSEIYLQSADASLNLTTSGSGIGIDNAGTGSRVHGLGSIYNTVKGGIGIQNSGENSYVEVGFGSGGLLEQYVSAGTGILNYGQNSRLYLNWNSVFNGTVSGSGTGFHNRGQGSIIEIQSRTFTLGISDSATGILNDAGTLRIGDWKDIRIEVLGSGKGIVNNSTTQISKGALLDFTGEGTAILNTGNFNVLAESSNQTTIQTAGSTIINSASGNFNFDTAVNLTLNENSLLENHGNLSANGSSHIGINNSTATNAGSGKLNINTGSSLIISESGQLNNQGNFNASGSSYVEVNNSTLINAESGNFNLNSGSNLLLKEGGLLDNQGNLSVNGVTEIQVLNSTIINKATGTLAFDPNATLNLKEGARLLNEGSLSATKAVWFEGGNHLIAGSGYFDIDLQFMKSSTRLSPGAYDSSSDSSSIGTMTINGYQSWQNGLIYDWQLGSLTNTSTAANDWISIAGALSLSNASIYDTNINLATSLDASTLVGGRAWTLLTASGGISGFTADNWNRNSSLFNQSASDLLIMLGFQDISRFFIRQNGNNLELVYQVTDYYWNPNTSSNWTIGSNWFGNTTANESGANVYFVRNQSSRATVDMQGSTQTIGNLTIGSENSSASSTYNITNGTLNINGNGSPSVIEHLADAVGTDEISANIVNTANNLAIDVQSSGDAKLVLSGSINNAAGRTISRTGGGNLVLNMNAGVFTNAGKFSLQAGNTTLQTSNGKGLLNSGDNSEILLEGENANLLLVTSGNSEGIDNAGTNTKIHGKGSVYSNVSGGVGIHNSGTNSLAEIGDGNGGLLEQNVSGGVGVLNTGSNSRLYLNWDSIYNGTVSGSGVGIRNNAQGTIMEVQSISFNQTVSGDENAIGIHNQQGTLLLGDWNRNAYNLKTTDTGTGIRNDSEAQIRNGTTINLTGNGTGILNTGNFNVADSYAKIDVTDSAIVNAASGNFTVGVNSDFIMNEGARFINEGSFSATKALGFSGGNQLIAGGGTFAADLSNIGPSTRLSPGAYDLGANSSGIGTMTINSDQSWLNGFIYDWQLGSLTDTSTTANDWINITGSLTFNNAANNNLYSLNLLTAAGLDTSAILARDRAWTLLTASGGISGFNADAWNNNSVFADNALALLTLLGLEDIGKFVIKSDGTNLQLVYELLLDGYYWKSGTGSGAWNTGANWVGELMPDLAGLDVFLVRNQTARATINMESATRTMGNLTIGSENASATTQYTVSNGVLHFNGNGSLSTLTHHANASGTDIISANITAANNLTIDVQSRGSASLEISGSLRNEQGRTITRTGNGNLTLSGNTVNNGTLSFTAGNTTLTNTASIENQADNSNLEVKGGSLTNIVSSGNGILNNGSGSFVHISSGGNLVQEVSSTVPGIGILNNGTNSYLLMDGGNFTQTINGISHGINNAGTGSYVEIRGGNFTQTVDLGSQAIGILNSGDNSRLLISGGNFTSTLAGTGTAIRNMGANSSLTISGDANYHLTMCSTWEGIYNFDANSRVIITDNARFSQDVSSGSAIYNSGQNSSVSINGSATFIQNITNGRGIYNPRDYNSVNISENARFTNNVTGGTGVDNSGIYANTTISGAAEFINEVRGSGTGILNNGANSSLLINGASFTNNVTGSGTGIRNNGANSSITLSNGSFEQNVTNGIGIDNVLGNLTINSTGTISLTTSNSGIGIRNNATLVLDANSNITLTGGNSIVNTLNGLMLIDGTVSGTGNIRMDGGLLVGSGSIANLTFGSGVASSRTIRPGAYNTATGVSSIGTLSFTGSQNWGAFTYGWQLGNLSATTGGNGNDWLDITGSLSLASTTYALNASTLLSSSVDNIYAHQEWVLMSASGGINNFSLTQWAISLDSSWAALGLSGNLNRYSVIQDGNDLKLHYDAGYYWKANTLATYQRWSNGDNWIYGEVPNAAGTQVYFISDQDTTTDLVDLQDQTFTVGNMTIGAESGHSGTSYQVWSGTVNFNNLGNTSYLTHHANAVSNDRIEANITAANDLTVDVQSSAAGRLTFNGTITTEAGNTFTKTGQGGMLVSTNTSNEFINRGNAVFAQGSTEVTTTGGNGILNTGNLTVNGSASLTVRNATTTNGIYNTGNVAVRDTAVLNATNTTFVNTGNINVDSGAVFTLGENARLINTGNYTGTGAMQFSGGNHLIAGTGRFDVALDNMTATTRLSPGAYNISSGVSSIGQMTINGTQSWHNGFIYDWQLGSFQDSSAGSNDWIGITGSLSLSTIADYALIISPVSGLDVTNLPAHGMTWNLLTASGGITGFNDQIWNNNSLFANSALDLLTALGLENTGKFVIRSSGTSLQLVYQLLSFEFYWGRDHQGYWSYADSWEERQPPDLAGAHVHFVRKQEDTSTVNLGGNTYTVGQITIGAENATDTTTSYKLTGGQINLDNIGSSSVITHSANAHGDEIAVTLNASNDLQFDVQSAGNSSLGRLAIGFTPSGDTEWGRWNGRITNETLSGGGDNPLLTVSQNIQMNGHDLVKSGNGTLLVTADILGAQQIRHNAGSLFLDGNVAVANGLTVAGNAILGGGGTINGSITFAHQAIFRQGRDGAKYNVRMLLDGTAAAQGNMTFDLTAALGRAFSDNDGDSRKTAMQSSGLDLTGLFSFSAASSYTVNIYNLTDFNIVDWTREKNANEGAYYQLLSWEGGDGNVDLDKWSLNFLGSVRPDDPGAWSLKLGKEGDKHILWLYYANPVRIPEPGTYAAIAAGLALGFVLIRRRRK